MALPRSVLGVLLDVEGTTTPLANEAMLISSSTPGGQRERKNSVVAAAIKAIERSFGEKPVFMREGGSIPIVTTFRQQLGVDTLLLGWGLDDDNTHSPNEKFNLADFQRGIRASAYLWEELAKVKK